MPEAADSAQPPHALAHQALFYRDDRDYVAGISRFIQPGLDAGEPVAVAVPPPRGQLLREQLGAVVDGIQMLDMYELARNAARIIPAVHELLARHGGALLHYVGEPIWPGRSADEIREATRHEALINLAWPAAQVRVLCPYDAVALDEQVLSEAERTHPWLIRGEGGGALSHAYTGSAIPDACDLPLPEPPPEAARLSFDDTDLSRVRAIAGNRATAAGLAQARATDLVLAVNEVATNAIKHAGGPGLMRVWMTPTQVVCQLEDRGHIGDPLAGRYLPTPSVDGGLGLWMVNQLCDLVQTRTGALGTIIRLTMNLR